MRTTILRTLQAPPSLQSDPCLAAANAQECVVVNNMPIRMHGSLAMSFAWFFGCLSAAVPRGAEQAPSRAQGLARIQLADAFSFKPLPESSARFARLRKSRRRQVYPNRRPIRTSRNSSVPRKIHGIVSREFLPNHLGRPSSMAEVQMDSRVGIPSERIWSTKQPRKRS